MKRRVVVITDPGQDSAVALLTLLALPDSFEVLGIVASAGNIPLRLAVVNCLKVLELAGRPDIPVYAGCERPMVRPLVTAEHVHGPTGIDGFELPPPSIAAQSKRGVAFLIDTLLAAAPGEITIVALSPLTNLGVALVEAPAIARSIRQIVSMSGAYFEVGNITPAAEFNIYVDPHAADVVLKSGIPIVMLPLDVTHQMRSTPERLQRFAAIGNRAGAAVAGWLRFSEAFDQKKYGWEGAPLHSPCVPAYMLAPELFESRLINVSVELHGELTIGMTVADWWQITDRPRNVTYVRGGDADGFYDLLVATLAHLP